MSDTKKATLAVSLATLALVINKPITVFSDDYKIPKDTKDFTLNQEIDTAGFDVEALVLKELNKHAFQHFVRNGAQVDAETGAFVEPQAFYTYINSKLHGSRIDTATKERAVDAVKAILKERGVKDNAILAVGRSIKNATTSTVQDLNAINPSLCEGIEALLIEANQVELSAMWSTAMSSEKDLAVAADDLLG